MTLQLLVMLIFATVGTTQAATSVKFRDALTYGVVTVGVGNPPKHYSLILDPNSANTWVGAGKPYVKTSTSTDTGQTVEVTYGNGGFSGNEYTDQVTLGPGLVVPGQSIGVASSSSGFEGVDGILGLGPTALSVGTLSPDTSAEIPTVTDNLFSEGSIAAREFAISAQPSIPLGELSELNDEITFGGVDPSKYTGSITYVPITSTSPASSFWGLDATFTYGTASTPILSTTAGIVDHATTLLFLASDAFQKFQDATGGVLDQATGLLKITAVQYDQLQSLHLHIGDTSFEITKNALIWPRVFNTMIGGDAGSIYLVVSDLGTPSGQGLDFMIGYSILKRFYTVFDTANQRIGFATTPFTDATSN